MNRVRTPEECVETVVAEADQLIADDVCLMCAIRVVAKKHDVDRGRVLDLWLDEDRKRDDAA